MASFEETSEGWKIVPSAGDPMKCEIRLPYRSMSKTEWIPKGCDNEATVRFSSVLDYGPHMVNVCSCHLHILTDQYTYFRKGFTAEAL